jgi:hypothetical protein
MSDFWTVGNPWDGDPGALPPAGGALPNDLLTRLLQSGALAGLLTPAMDPAAQAAAARDAAGTTLMDRMGRRSPAAAPPSPFDTAVPGALPDGVPSGLPFAGLLNGGGGFGPAPGASSPAFDLPPSANDPVAREPDFFQGGAPLPRPLPTVAGAGNAMPAENVAVPFSLAPGGGGVGSDVPLPRSRPGKGETRDPNRAMALWGSLSPGAPRNPITSPANPSDVAVPESISGQPSGMMGKIFNPANAPTLLGMASGFSGAGSIGSGMKKAFGNAVAPAAQLRQEQLMQMGQADTYRALVARGASPQEALAAVRDPEIKKAMVGRLFEAKTPEWKEVGRDRNGQPIHGWVDPGKQTVNGMPMSQFLASQNATASGSDDAGLTGEPYLKTHHPEEQSIIKKLVSYDLDPRLLSAKGNHRERMLAAAERYDPDYSQSLYVPRAAALKEFLSGGPNSPASIITAGNTAIQHLGEAKDHSDKIGGVNNAWLLNKPLNWMNATAQDFKNDPNLVKYKSAADRFSEEGTKFYRGVGWWAGRYPTRSGTAHAGTVSRGSLRCHCRRGRSYSGQGQRAARSLQERYGAERLEKGDEPSGLRISCHSAKKPRGNGQDSRPDERRCPSRFSRCVQCGDTEHSVRCSAGASRKSVTARSIRCEVWGWYL